MGAGRGIGTSIRSIVESGARTAGTAGICAKPVVNGRIGVWQGKVRRDLSSANYGHRRWGCNKQEVYVLLVLWLFAVVGVVGDILDGTRIAFPAPPRPKDTCDNKENW